MTNKTLIILALVLVALAGCTQPANNTAGNNDANSMASDENTGGNNMNASLTVAQGDTVQVHYRGTLDDGTEFDSSLKPGRTPLEFTAGAGQMIPGFDAAVIGMHEGDEKTVTLAPAQAYGEERSDLIQTVPKTQFGREWNDLTVGSMIMASNGQRGTITAKTEETATVNFNHELAGKTLTFWIQMVSITKG